MSRKKKQRKKQNKSSKIEEVSNSPDRKKPVSTESKKQNWWTKRKIKSRGKELGDELYYILKRYKSRKPDEKTPLYYRLISMLPPGNKLKSLSADQEDKIKKLVDKWKKSLKTNDEDLDSIVKELENLLSNNLEKYRKSKVWGYIKSFSIAAIIALSLRAFAFEPFRIPSGSMIPTLQVGDFIYVNKFVYGLRIPFTQHPPKQFIEWSLPERGDIIVFIEPINNSEDWIKRVIGLPGDEIKFDFPNSQIYIKRGGKGEWKPVPRKKLQKKCSYMDKNEKLHEDWHPGKPCVLYEEELDGHKYNVMYDQIIHSAPLGYPTHWKVPEDSVFVMGDNRDNSEDSRFLTKNDKPHPFIPLHNIKGRAEFIWMSWGPDGQRWKRLFTGIH